MTKTALTTLALIFSAGLAQAQTADATRIAHEAAGPAGTVGAMASATYGLATSAEDVMLQQRGMTTMAQGAQPIATTGSTQVVAAPGTVGAAPGSTPGQ